MYAIVTRSLGAGRSLDPSADAGMIVGNPMPAPIVVAAVERNFLRVCFMKRVCRRPKRPDKGISPRDGVAPRSTSSTPDRNSFPLSYSHDGTRSGKTRAARLPTASPQKKHPLRNHAHDAPHMPRRSGTGTNSSHGAIHVVTKLIHVGRRQFVVQPDTNSTDQNLSIRPCLKQRRCRTHSLTEKNSGLQRKTSPTSRAIESVLAGPQPPGSSEPYPTYCASSRLASPSYPRSLHRLERLPSCIAPFHRRCHPSA